MYVFHCIYVNSSGNATGKLSVVQSENVTKYSDTTDTLTSPQRSPIHSSRQNYDKKVNNETKGSLDIL